MWHGAGAVECNRGDYEDVGDWACGAARVSTVRDRRRERKARRQSVLLYGRYATPSLSILTMSQGLSASRQSFVTDVPVVVTGGISSAGDTTGGLVRDDTSSVRATSSDPSDGTMTGLSYVVRVCWGVGGSGQAALGLMKPPCAAILAATDGLDEGYPPLHAKYLSVRGRRCWVDRALMAE